MVCEPVDADASVVTWLTAQFKNKSRFGWFLTIFSSSKFQPSGLQVGFRYKLLRKISSINPVSRE